MVVALAGRRIDADGQAQAHFPLARVEAVRQKLRALLIEQDARVLVCSAACGADLLALGEAGRIGMERHVILPFEMERFRASSVTDRPGAWGEAFDRVMAEARGSGSLVVMPDAQDSTAAYIAVNRCILEKTRELALRTHDRAAAVLVWDRRSRGPGDLTAEFGSEARGMGFELFEIDTLERKAGNAIPQP